MARPSADRDEPALGAFAPLIGDVAAMDDRIYCLVCQKLVPATTVISTRHGGAICRAHLGTAEGDRAMRVW